MKILALDQANACGYAHSNGQHGTWKITSRGEPHGRRLRNLRARIHGVHRMWGIELIACEAASFGSINPNTQAMHNELRGVIWLVAEELGCDVLEFHPTSIKAFATGSGRADKMQMMAACKRLLGIEPRDDNEADAIWILEMAKQNYQPPPSKKKARKANKIFYKHQPTLFR